MVQAWYQGGISIFDWTDVRKPTGNRVSSTAARSIPRAWAMAARWSVYWYNGVIVSSEIARGLDIFELTPSAYISQNEIDAAKTVHFDYLNAQGQPKLVWPPSFALARAFADQLERSNGLPAARLAAVRESVRGAERASGAARALALTQIASQLGSDAANSSDAGKVRMLANALTDLAAAR